MKKAAILTITACYLLLTTGIYVCLLACASAAPIAKTAMEMSHDSACETQSNAHTNTVKFHSCCANNDSFVSKEHQEQGAELKFKGSFAILNPLFRYDHATGPAFRNSSRLADDHNVPWQSGKARSIRFRCIQI